MRRGDSGLTLVEVLVAMVLIAFCTLAVAPMFVSAMASNAASADFGWVGAHAVERMELLRSENYSALTVGGNLTADTNGYFNYPETGIVVRWQIVDNSGAVPGTKVVTVRSEALRNVTGPNRVVTLSSIRGD